MLRPFWNIFFIMLTGLICAKEDENMPLFSGNLPPPFSNSKSFKRRPGVFIEKWEGIDSFTVSSLTQDSRFPHMPTQFTYSTMFTQPQNWGENFGTRIRTYFVPKVTGRHTFYVSSDNEGQVWLSKDIWPQHKSKIAWINGEHFSEPRVYNKFPGQKSWPITLIEGSYYYMESLMKENYDDDHFSVAVQLPGEKGVPIGPITEDYLWTDIPRPNKTENGIDQSSIYQIAALAGAKSGTLYGMEAGAKSAVLTGAMAGHIAGLQAGAIAAQQVAEAAAREVFEKAFSTTFAAYSKQLKGLDARLFGPKGNSLYQQIMPTNITDAGNAFNVRVNQFPNGQTSFNGPGTGNPGGLSYLPNAGANPKIGNLNGMLPSINNPAGSISGIINSNVYGSSGQVMRRRIYVKKPDYYRYHGPAKGLQKRVSWPTYRKSSDLNTTKELIQDKTIVKVSHGDEVKRPWPLPIFTPLYPQNLQNYQKRQNQENFTNTIRLASQSTDQVLTNVQKSWQKPKFTPLEPPETYPIVLRPNSGAEKHKDLSKNSHDSNEGITEEMKQNRERLEKPDGENRRTIPIGLEWVNTLLNRSWTGTNRQSLQQSLNLTKTQPVDVSGGAAARPKAEFDAGDINKNSTDYNLTQSTREDEQFVYYPKLGEDADEVARRLVYESGCAKKIVFNAHYSIHSIDIPAIQLDLTKNSCINSHNGEVFLRPFCQYFIIREGLLPNTDSDDISLESACNPDHFLAQRNYRFYIKKRDGTLRFAREATFAFYKTITFPQSLQIMAFSHYLWFVCESEEKDRRKTKLILEYIRSKDDEFERCSFSFVPMPNGTNEHVNCKGVLDQRRPEIKGNEWNSLDKHYARVVPNEATCMALNFINKAGRSFYVYSSIKNNKYLVNNNGLKIKTMIKRPDLHNHVTYKADPIGGNYLMLLNGLQSLTVLPQKTCDDFVPVHVTSIPGGPIGPVGPVGPRVIKETHYHYHLQQRPASQNTGCPPMCSGSPPCPASCPTRCCKRHNAPTRRRFS